MSKPANSFGFPALAILALTLAGLGGCQDFRYPMAVKVDRNPVAYTKPDSPPPPPRMAAPGSGPAPTAPTPLPQGAPQPPLNVPVYTAPTYRATGGTPAP